MRITRLGTTLLLLLNGYTHAVDETQPYGRICVSLFDPAQRTEVAFSDESKPNGQRVVVRLEANASCEAVVAAFSKKTGEIPNGWRPMILSLGEWDQQIVPPTEEPWSWNESSDSFEIVAVFLPKAAAGTDKVRTLVTNLREPKNDPTTAKLQARQLRQELTKWAADESSISSAPGSAPVKIGGTVRNAGEFPWREHARALNFSETKPAVTVFRHGPR